MEAPIGFMVALNPNLFKSKISNCSQEGIFFESELKLLPGTVVFISSDGDSKYYRAEVKWSEKLDQSWCRTIRHRRRIYRPSIAVPKSWNQIPA